MAHRVALTVGLGLTLLVGATSSIRAEDGPKGHVSVRFLTELNTVPLTLGNDTVPFADWLKPVIAAVEARFPKDAGRQSIVVQIVLHHDGPAEIEFAGNPRLSDEDIKAIQAVADPAKAPRAKVATCVFRVVARVQEGEPDDLPGLSPALKSPRERLLARVQSASTREALGLLRQWAIEESLPLLAASANAAEEKYAGVRNLGKALSQALATPKMPLNVETLVMKNSDFWRATMEMQPGNPLTPAVESSLLLAAGRIEWAQQIAAMSGFFDGNKSGASDLRAFSKTLAEAYLKGLNDRIGKVIALHDRGQFVEALAAFDAILKDDPQSAWALYERFHTRRMMTLKPGSGEVPGFSNAWPDTRAAILASNPLYRTMAQAGGAEGIFDLTRRLALAGLFQDQNAGVKDVLTYADVSLDLKAFDMAAMLYWSLLTTTEPRAYDNRPLLENFLYALERLGIKDLKTNFQGNHAAAFVAIEADRRKRVDAGPVAPRPDAPKVEPKPATGKP